jgi:hypothetical protein
MMLINIIHVAQTQSEMLHVINIIHVAQTQSEMLHVINIIHVAQTQSENFRLSLSYMNDVNYM